MCAVFCTVYWFINRTLFTLYIVQGMSRTLLLAINLIFVYCRHYSVLSPFSISARGGF